MCIHAINKDVLRRFDNFIESRFSYVLGWLWKSGLMVILITLLLGYLKVQRDNSFQLVKNSESLSTLIKINEQLAAITKEHTDSLSSVKVCVSENKSEIRFLRRDVDILIKPIIKKGL